MVAFLDIMRQTNMDKYFTCNITIRAHKYNCWTCGGSCRDPENGSPCGVCQGEGELYDVEETLKAMPEGLRNAIESHYDITNR